MPPDSDRPVARAVEAPDEVFRLHPLTPLALGARVLGLLAFFLVIGRADRSGGGGGGGVSGPVVLFGVLAVVIVVRGLIAVAVTSYHVFGRELRVDNGLLQRQSKRIRLDRVQSVDVLEPLSARIFGLAEVRVTTAGSERAAIRLRYLASPVAHRLRADLLQRSTGSVGEPVETPDRLLVTVPHGRLVAALLLQMFSWRLVFLAIGPTLALVGARNGHRTTTGVGVALFVSIGLAFVLSAWRQINLYWEFTVSDATDGLRVRHGLLSTSRQTVPPGRIQAVLVHQPLAWRPFGWAQVRMNVAGYGRSESSGRRSMLLPVVDRDEAERFVGWLLGGLDLGTVPLARPPRRAALRAPLWWRYQLAGADERFFLVHHGCFSRTVDIVPHERTQSLRLSQGPVARALRLASVHLDSTPGPVKTRAAHRDAGEARAMLDRQVEHARTARALRDSTAAAEPVPES
jgi:putative membrane protein